MAKNQDKPKHTVIVDADLHIQDPHEIILSYFNTKNDTQFAKGDRKQFRNRLIGLFVMLIFMKMFFQEMFSGWFFSLLTMIVMVLLGFIFAETLVFTLKAFNNTIKKDGLRGMTYTLVAVTIIMLILGLFF